MDLLTGLNPQQQTAVTAGNGPILVLAGPGSGKTRVLTHRIAYLIQEQRLAPWHILAVTFTNKAAREMNHRIENLVGGQPRGLSMGTFHSTCVRLLRQEAEHLSLFSPQLTRDFVIFDTADQQQAIKQALADLNLDDKKFTPGGMLGGISSAKNELITPELYTATNYISEVNKRVYTRYQQILLANNALDFDDLLLNVVLILRQKPEVLEKYREKYQYILVDEFQDTNTVQYALLKELSAKYRNIFAVGDPDQSIYKWRGADFRNVGRFREEYPDSQTILLEQNYRSTQTILDAATAVIKHNPHRVHRELFSDSKGGQRVNIREAYDETEEAEGIVTTIRQLARQGQSLSDFAVMYRMNSQSRAIEDAFVAAKLPYRLVGATQFYKRREVKDLMAYLRIIHNPADSVSLGRILNVPTRGIGDKTRDELLTWANNHGWQPAQALLKLTEPDIQHPFRGRAFSALNEVGQMLQAWIALSQQASIGQLFDAVVEKIGYRGYLEDGTDEGRERWANIVELRNVAGSNDSATLSDFLESIALVSETDNLPEEVEAPTLLTLHAAKGLEFPVVFIAGLEDGTLPHSRSMEDPEELAEERRLFYVGITRAEKRLYLSHVFRRMSYGGPEIMTPSRFLGTIPDNLLEVDKKPRTATSGSWNTFKSPTAPAKNYSWSSGSSSQGRGTQRPSTPAFTPRREFTPPAKPTPEAKAAADLRAAQYRTGEKVRHVKFGDGIVIESKVLGTDEEVTVAFAKEGIKRLAASIAKLEKL